METTVNIWKLNIWIPETFFYCVRLPLEFLPVSGPLTRWCASTLSTALLCSSWGALDTVLISRLFCISTSFRVLRAPKSWTKLIFYTITISCSLRLKERRSTLTVSMVQNTEETGDIDMPYFNKIIWNPTFKESGFQMFPDFNLHLPLVWHRESNLLCRWPNSLLSRIETDLYLPSKLKTNWKKSLLG